MPVPLAPLAEQRRIVAKLDRLFARTSRARAELGHIPQLIERYRAIFLVKLFDSVNGVKKRLKDLVPPSAPIRYGVVQPGEIKDQGIQLIRVCDLLNNRVAWNQLRRVSPEVDSKYLAARVDNGDVLLSVVGTIGRVAIVRGLTEPTNIARAVARIRPNSELVRSEWLMWRLQAQDMQDRFTGDAREVARKTLNVSLVKEAEVILPPLDEQDSMVAKINTAFEVLDRTYKETVAAHDQTVRLVEVSLAKAFQGKLVPQDPNDEPASELLDRIRIERAARSNNGRNHRRK
jgi:type I restriction enzyme S subunit